MLEPENELSQILDFDAESDELTLDQRIRKEIISMFHRGDLYFDSDLKEDQITMKLKYSSGGFGSDIYVLCECHVDLPDSEDF